MLHSSFSGDPRSPMLKTALVHDWLFGIAGGEKCLEAICELYDAPIYTLFYDKAALQDTIFAQREVHPSFLQRLPQVKKYYRNLLPLFPTAIERLDLSGYPVVISSSHAVAKGVKLAKEQRHICYCFSPMRYAWDLADFHLAHLSRLKRLVAKPTLSYLRRWDQKASARVDHFVAISHCIAQRIRTHYGREAAVIYPPVDTHLFSIAAQKEEYYFTCSRLVPYKRIDLLLEVFEQMPHQKLVVVGDGPEMKALKARAPRNVELLGFQPDAVVRELLSKARAFVFAPVEDFGIVAVEAQAAGVPVIAYGRGGNLETVTEGVSGLFFQEQTVPSLLEAIQRFERSEGQFDPHVIKQGAEKFSKARFQREFQAFVESKVGE